MEDLEKRIAEIIENVRTDCYEQIKFSVAELKSMIAEIYYNHPEVTDRKDIAGISKESIVKAERDYAECEFPDEEIDAVTEEEMLEFLKPGRLQNKVFKKKYPNAYKPWTKTDDNELEKLWCEGEEIVKIASALKRNANAIIIRIEKLELQEKYGERPEGRLTARRRYSDLPFAQNTSEPRNAQA